MPRKIANPHLFSSVAGIDKKVFKKTNLFDPILSVDTPLFIDPMLLGASKVPEMVEAQKSYKIFFEKLLKLLAASRKENDVAWKAAKKMLSFHELPGTCLGYGSGSINGSGWGSGLTDQLLVTAKEIVDMGVTDPDLFMMLGLFEEGIGPDRISDMVTNVIRRELIALNVRIAQKFKLETEHYSLNGEEGELFRNPMQGRNTPVILVPADVLRALPIALDYDDVVENAQRNAELRNRLNAEVGDIWQKAHSTQEKEALRRSLFKSKVAINTWLQAMKDTVPKAYDYEKDSEGVVRWAEIAATIAEKHPFEIEAPVTKNSKGINKVVSEVIGQFRHLMEERDLWKEMWIGKVSRSEKTAQRLFFAVAYSYCESNRLDISPEADTGNGPVDFKFSSGAKGRVLVEIKLSKGTVEHGYTVQLPKYMAAEKAEGVFLILDVGRLGSKMNAVQGIRTRLLAEKKSAPPIEYIDCTPRTSASKLPLPKKKT